MLLTKESFENLELADLLLNIWSNSDKQNYQILQQYTNWNIELAREQWDDDRFHDFNVIIGKTLIRDKSLNLWQISSAEKYLIYHLISK